MILNDVLNCETMRYILVIYLTVFSTSIQGQSDSVRPDWNKLETELNLSLKGTNKYNVVNSKDAIINRDITFMNVAEAILIEIYGKENITKQKPFRIYHIKNYWINGWYSSEKFFRRDIPHHYR